VSVDPRQARTSAALRAALVRLLGRRALDTITVSELCREAAVHRTTFYRHAERVDAFAVSVFSAELDALSDVRPTSTDAAAAATDYLAALRRTLEHLAAHRPIFRALFASSARGAFRAAVEDRLRHRARLALELFADAGVPGAPSDPRALTETAAFIAGAMVGVLDVWTQEEDADADAATSRLLALMPRWWPARA
jgi:AcrR family transcriptional regulator